MKRLLVNARVFRKAGAHHEAMLFDGEKIHGVGGLPEMRALGAGAVEEDLKGAWVLPGFIDPHHHFMASLFFGDFLDVGASRDIPELVARVADHARTIPVGRWLTASGYHPERLRERRHPTAHELEEASPAHPVFLQHYSGHEGVVSARGLARVGISRATLSPLGGTIETDRRGRLTGRLVEAAQDPVLRDIQLETGAALEDGFFDRVRSLQRTLLSYGITRFAEPGVPEVMEHAYREARRVGALSIPASVLPGTNRGVFAAPFDRLHGPPTGEGDVGPLKVFFDGADQCAMCLTVGQAIRATVSVLGRALRERSFEPIRVSQRSPLRFGDDGRLRAGRHVLPREVQRPLLSEAVERGFGLAIHALGNEAVGDALTQLALVRERHTTRAMPRLEHGLFINPADVLRLADSGVALVTQPLFLDKMGPENLPPLPGILRMPIRTLLDAGVLVAGSSDHPVATMDPLRAIERATTRLNADGHFVSREEAISVAEAVSLYTDAAARVLGCDGEAGALEAGKRADFVVLDGVPGAGATVRQTYVNGERVYARDGGDASASFHAA